MATNDSLAQLVEHLTFNQGVPSSSLGWITTKLSRSSKEERLFDMCCYNFVINVIIYRKILTLAYFKLSFRGSVYHSF